MIWIAGIVSFLVGSAAGALLFKIFRSDEARVKELQLKLQALSEEHERYKSNVHSHFNNSARLLNQLTDSYREVYLHMADGAQSLCPDYISSQLSLPRDQNPLVARESTPSATEAAPKETAPPLDYATRSRPDQKGNLAEDFGLDKKDTSS
jgi:uncharacterized membrane-anchored protein YhcB (DUF1043 family)